MPEQIKVLIVEDESIVAMDLAAGLENDGYVITGIADNFLDAVDLFTKIETDIVLMDIHLKGDKDGVETAEEIMKLKQVPLIYLTAFTDPVTIERVKHTNPSTFLTKPYSIENVRIAMDLALHNFAEARMLQHQAKILNIRPGDSSDRKTEKEHFLQLRDYIFIKQNYRFIKLKLSEILFAEADNNYVHLYTANQKFAIRISLSDLIDRLNFSRLARVHRSFAVNLDEIISFDDEIIKIASHEIPIGRNYRQEFLSHFNWK
jgi:DNA-binding LytR/AlgR family response regulator